jgi:hypothetical protein
MMPSGKVALVSSKLLAITQRWYSRFRVTIDRLAGLGSAPALALAHSSGLPAEFHSAFDITARRLNEVFVVCDALLAEINRLATTSKGNLLSLDGKVVVGDNAFFPPLGSGLDRDEAALDTGGTLYGIEAHEAGLSYVHPGGESGWAVNWPVRPRYLSTIPSGGSSCDRRERVRRLCFRSLGVRCRSRGCGCWHSSDRLHHRGSSSA